MSSVKLCVEPDPSPMHFQKGIVDVAMFSIDETIYGHKKWVGLWIFLLGIALCLPECILSLCACLYDNIIDIYVIVNHLTASLW